MKFYSDYYFQIGQSHLIGGKPCQDFALSSDLQNGACAIVSDGCSTGRHTDLGARVLTFATLSALKNPELPNKIGYEFAGRVQEEQKRKVDLVKANLGLEKVDLLSTCLYIYVSENGGYIRVNGDGVVAVKFRDGRIVIRRFEWAKNAPFYPTYDHLDVLPFLVQIHNGSVDSAKMTITEVEYFNREFFEQETINFSFWDAMEGIVTPLSKEELEKEVEFIAVFSDGVAQIDGVDWKDAVVEFLNFKSLTGEFAKRRMIRGIKDYQKVGRGPIDDISYAVVRIEPGETGEG